MKVACSVRWGPDEKGVARSPRRLATRHAVASDYPCLNVVGVDINETMIGYATAFARVQGRPNISFESMDIKQPLTFPDASFELINARFIVGFQDKASWPVLLCNA